MASLTEAREAPERQMWDEINGIHAGMLGIEGAHMHFQPMAPNVDSEANTIWFYTRTDTDLVKALGTASRAHFNVVGKDHDYHACLSGTLEVRKDEATAKAKAAEAETKGHILPPAKKGSAYRDLFKVLLSHINGTANRPAEESFVDDSEDDEDAE